MTGDEVRSAAFRAAIGGYRFQDVDQLLAIVADLIDAEVCPSVALAATRLRRSPRGYDAAEVDRFLDRIRAKTAILPSSRERARLSGPSLELSGAGGDGAPAPSGSSMRPAADIDLAGTEGVGEGARTVERLLLQRGAIVPATDALRIADYLLAQDQGRGNRQVEVRRGPTLPSIVLTTHEVLAELARKTAAPSDPVQVSVQKTVSAGHQR